MSNGDRSTGHLTIRAPRDLVHRFGQAVKLADPDMSASDAVRGLVRWYLGEGPLPKLPPTRPSKGGKDE
jgi:hypothetical protein